LVLILAARKVSTQTPDARARPFAAGEPAPIKREFRMPFYAIDDLVPVIDPSSYVHPLAAIIGDVIIGQNCYIGPFASLRGDFNRIVIDDGSNVQESCTIHTGVDTPTIIGRNGHVGHGAVLHGCELKSNVLVGMNATVMDSAIIGENSIIGAMAFVKAGFDVPPGVLVAGIPAKVVRSLSEADLAQKATGTALYQELARRSLASLHPVEPLRLADNVRLAKGHH